MTAVQPPPGLDAAARWILPADLNMARQALDHAPDKLAIIDLSAGPRQDVYLWSFAPRDGRWPCPLFAHAGRPR